MAPRAQEREGERARAHFALKHAQEQARRRPPRTHGVRWAQLHINGLEDRGAPNVAPSDRPCKATVLPLASILQAIGFGVQTAWGGGLAPLVEGALREVNMHMGDAIQDASLHEQLLAIATSHEFHASGRILPLRINLALLPHMALRVLRLRHSLTWPSSQSVPSAFPSKTSLTQEAEFNCNLTPSATPNTPQPDRL